MAPETMGIMDDPRFKSARFTCVHSSCRAAAEHGWSHVACSFPGRPNLVESMNMARCGACGRHSLWIEGALGWPLDCVGDPPHPDMPAEVGTLHREAQYVAAISPRGAAALQRLALQTLLDALVPEGGGLNDKIGRLVEQGITKETQQAMDVVRIVGNNGAHPGEINLSEDGALIPSLCKLMNMIIHDLVARPRIVDEFYESLPPGAREAVVRRDGAHPPAIR